jgi:predicted nucleic acid-binding protein
MGGQGLPSDPRVPGLTLQTHDETLYASALTMMNRSADKQWRITDAVSFVTMKRRDCGRAFTGDRQFIQAGFQVVPG